MAEKYLFEAFQALEELNEDVFNLNANEATELKDFVSDDINSSEMEDIIDPLAQTEEDLQDSYIGKAILDCIICQSKIYKDPSEVIINEEGDLANIGEDCPYCQSADGYKVIGQVAPYTNNEVDVQTDSEEVNVEVEEKEESDDNLNEDLNNVQIETDKEKITITSEEKEEVQSEPVEESEEIIAPVSDETEAEFNKEEPEQAEEVESEPDYQDIDIEEFEEEDFDNLGEGYLKKVYENVANYKTTKGSIKGNELKLEGIITFKSGKEVKTNFVFESKSVTKTGKLKFIGENKQFAKGKNAFTLTGKMNGKKLVTESLTYNYRAKDSNGASKRLYGRVCK